ncbi:MAG: exodeoxyribonuclease VII large subunit [Calditrichaceae bacterium]
MSESNIYSVGEITRTIKLLIEENLPTIWIEGEVSNFKPHYSGHYYFTLKDTAAQISAVMWSSRAGKINFDLEDGMLVQALGNVRLWEKSGRYQFDVLRIQPAGIGQLQMAFERLKQKLQAEGLFDPEHKKTLPPYPHKIGIVTSSTGAAIKDIINVLKRRAPHVEIVVRSAKVQGQGAAEDIAKAIREFNQFKNVDILIVGRGGGSLEDLWPFNEEVVARAIYASEIPVVSAVGHEIDFTIADFVSDLRAPTPSAAAELVVPDYHELRNKIIEYYRRLYSSMENRIDYNREKIIFLQKSYGMRRQEDLIRQYMYQIDDINVRINKGLKNLLLKKSEYLNQMSHRLNNLNPKKVLERGYSISYIDGEIIKNATQVTRGGELETQLFKGRLTSIISKTNKDE